MVVMKSVNHFITSLNTEKYFLLPYCIIHFIAQTFTLIKISLQGIQEIIKVRVVKWIKLIPDMQKWKTWHIEILYLQIKKFHYFLEYTSGFKYTQYSFILHNTT